MLANIPTFIYPFLVAAIALLAGRVLGGSRRDDPESLPRVMLWAIAAACVVLGIYLFWLERHG